MPENRDRYVVLCQQVLALATVVAVAVPAATVVPLDIVAPDTAGTAAPNGAPDPVRDGASSPGAEHARVATAPVAPEVRTLPLAGVDTSVEEAADPHRVAARLSSGDAQGGGPHELAAVTTPEKVHGYTTVGVTWAGRRVDEDDIAVAVRSLEDGAWSGWEEVEYHDDHGPTPGSDEARGIRAGTDPILVGDVDKVQVRVETADGSLPRDAQVAVIDPGSSARSRVEEPAIDTSELAAPAQTPEPSPEPSPEPGPEPDGTTEADPETGDEGVLSAASWATPKPKIYSRAQWGANEKMRDGSPSYYEVHAGFVHHTVNANGYSRGDVPALIRGIYAYHTQSKGWSDVGYNFIVDRFGRIWEGRAGGVDRPVVGAHTLGYNEYSFAMSALGNFETARPSSAMLDSYGRLFAWKLSLHGVDADDMSQRVGGGTFPAINGHRDAGQTACPGRHLYAKVGQIRDLAESYQRPFAERTRSADLAGSPWPDLMVRRSGNGQVMMLRTGGQIGFQKGRIRRTGWNAMDLVTAAQDVTGDGIGDLVGRNAKTKVSGVYPGNAQGGFDDPSLQTKRFGGLDLLEGSGDLTGDRNADLIGRVRKTQKLYVYPGNGKGGFRHRKLLSGDWSAYVDTVGVGDLDGDGDDDLVGRADGKLLLVPGTDGLSLGAPVTLPGSWGHYDLLSGQGDVTGDGRPDVLARARGSKQTYLFPGNGAGGFGERFGPFGNFRYASFLGSVGNLAGDPTADVVARDARGRIRVFPHDGDTNVESLTPAGFRARGANLIVNVGDWDGDGHGDVMTRSRRTGTLYLRRGDGKGGFIEDVKAASGWGKVRLVAAVGDITGDGNPDLMGQPRGSAMRIYPGDGGTGFRSSYVAHSAIGSTAQTGIGLWDGDGSPDSLAREKDGSMRLYRGNGPGGLLNPVKVAGAVGKYDWWQAVGDADGNGRPDLVARAKSNGALWLVPGTKKGFGRPRLLASGFSGYNMVG